MHHCKLPYGLFVTKGNTHKLLPYVKFKYFGGDTKLERRVASETRSQKHASSLKQAARRNRGLDIIISGKDCHLWDRMKADVGQASVSVRGRCCST